jgi:hypothetical protein
MNLKQLLEAIEKKAGDLVINGKRLGDVESYPNGLRIDKSELTSLDGCPKNIGGNFNCSANDLTSLKGCPEKVYGTFICSDNKLTSLKYGPTLVENEYWCGMNNLTSLEGCPEKIKSKFSCSKNKLTSLKGGPKIVLDNYWCDYNELTSLAGCPKEVKSFDCSVNKLTTLVGGPETVDGDFYCTNNQLETFDGFPKTISGKVFLAHNRFKNLHNIHKYLKSCMTLYLSDNTIESHVLGLLKIEKLKSVSISVENFRVQKIINKYLPLGDLFACQEELMAAGLEEYAQL